MTVCFITCFYGRAEKVERIIRYYLDQTSLEPSYLLLYNNGPNEQKLDDFHIPGHKHILLINNHLDLETGKEYKSTGDIFRDALTFAPDDTKVVNFTDSDDTFLQNHLSEGILGMERAYSNGQLSYKPYYSYFIYGNKVSLEHNNLEPSIFVDFEYIKKEGFDKTSASYHNPWLLKLRREDMMLQDKDGVSTFLYDWGSGHNTYKISGSGDDGETNLIAHRTYERDFGSGTLSPAQNYIVEKEYNRIKEFKNQLV